MDLTAYRTAILATLADPLGSRYDTAALDAALRQALREYSEAYPDIFTFSQTVTVVGQEQSLTSAGTGIMDILQVNYPYTNQLNPPLFESFYFYRLAGAPYMRFTSPAVPQVGQVIRVRATRLHTVNNLDSATATTVAPTHEHRLAAGAAGLAALTRVSLMVESYGTRTGDSKNLQAWAQNTIADFRKFLTSLHNHSPIDPLSPFGWPLDDHDQENY